MNDGEDDDENVSLEADLEGETKKKKKPKKKKMPDDDEEDDQVEIIDVKNETLVKTAPVQQIP